MYDIFAPQKVPLLKIFDDVIPCDLWFGPRPTKILATPMIKAMLTFVTQETFQLHFYSTVGCWWVSDEDKRLFQRMKQASIFDNLGHGASSSSLVDELRALEHIRTSLDASIDAHAVASETREADKTNTRIKSNNEYQIVFNRYCL